MSLLREFTARVYCVSLLRAFLQTVMTELEAVQEVVGNLMLEFNQLKKKHVGDGVRAGTSACASGSPSPAPGPPSPAPGPPSRAPNPLSSSTALIVRPPSVEDPVAAEASQRDVLREKLHKSIAAASGRRTKGGPRKK